jgi:hypothetical protein
VQQLIIIVIGFFFRMECDQTAPKSAAVVVADAESNKQNAAFDTPQDSPIELPEDSSGGSVCCSDCSTTHSLVWRRLDENGNTCRIVCNDCAGKQSRVRTGGSKVVPRNPTIVSLNSSNKNALDTREESTDQPEVKEAPVEGGTGGSNAVRKSVRSKRTVKVNHSTPKNHPNKGKGRRHIFKQQVSRSIEVKSNPQLIR